MLDVLRECREALSSHHLTHFHPLGHKYSRKACPTCALLPRLDALIAQESARRSCVGYGGGCDGDLEGQPHVPSCPAAISKTYSMDYGDGPAPPEMTPAYLATSEALAADHAPVAQPDNTIDLAQRRGRHMDIILEAISSYGSYMLNDDYDAQGCLDQIIQRMRDRIKDDPLAPPSSEPVAAQPAGDYEDLVQQLRRSGLRYSGYQTSIAERGLQWLGADAIQELQRQVADLSATISYERARNLEKVKAARAELSKLTAPVEGMPDHAIPYDHASGRWVKAALYEQLYEHAQSLSRRLEAAEKDAKRWQHWRTNHNVALLTSIFCNGCMNRTAEEAELIIDNEIAALTAAKESNEH